MGIVIQLQALELGISENFEHLDFSKCCIHVDSPCYDCERIDRVEKTLIPHEKSYHDACWSEAAATGQFINVVLYSALSAYLRAPLLSFA